ncbi:MAG: hypothetical protein HOV94_20225 [Saccharothrix sp.]|nr:hypothetical protein [Saccharothrix sp.]
MSNAANAPASRAPRPIARPPDGPNAERRRMLRVQVRLAVSVLAALALFAILTAIPATALLGTALLVAAAAMACGALIGFMFGIPRILEDRSQRGDVPTVLRPNTNLEQISDWLTKILVGVGLVQFSAIGDALGTLIDSIAVAFQPAAHATVLAGTLVVLPTVVGFLVSYIGARTWLFEMLNQFDSGIASYVRDQVSQAVAPVQAEVEQVQEYQRTLRELLAVTDAQLDTRTPEPDPGVLADVLAKATPGQREHAFRAARKARLAPGADDLVRRRALPLLQGLVDVDPDRYTYRAELGVILTDLGDRRRGLAALDEAIARRGAPTEFDWFEFHRARARLGLLGPGTTPDPDTAAQLRDDLAIAWRKPSFRAHVARVLGTPDEDDVEYRVLDRMRPYLPPEAALPDVPPPAPTLRDVTSPDMTLPEVTPPGPTPPGPTPPGPTLPETTPPVATEPVATEPETAEPDEPATWAPRPRRPDQDQRARHA